MNHLLYTELLARFIFSRKHYSVENNRVKHGAFMPLSNPDTSVFEVSIFKISGLADEHIWSIGDTKVAQPSGRTLYARGDISAGSVESNQLRVTIDDLPVRHGTITGWPEEESEQKLIAIELASSASLRVR